MKLARNKITEITHLLTPDGHISCNIYANHIKYDIFEYDYRHKVTCAKCKKTLRTYVDIIKYNVQVAGSDRQPVKLLSYIAPYLLHHKMINIKGGF